MSKINVELKQLVTICDDCKKSDYYDGGLQSCFVCNKDLCMSHWLKTGIIKGELGLCNRCKKRFNKFMKELSKEFEQ